jgi:hypothetical protein
MDKTNTKKLLCKFGFFMALTAVLYLLGVPDIVSSVKVQANVFPPGDACSEAIEISEVTNLSFDTTGARFGGRGLCMVSPNIWYCYTASCTGDVTVSLLGSSYDTMLAVYKGCVCFPTSSDFIACNDDFSGTYQSQITFAAIAGNQYLIEIGGYGGSQGKGFLNISCEGVFGPEKPDLGDAPDSTNNDGKVMGAYPSKPSILAKYPTVFDDGSGIGPYGSAHVNDEPVAYLGKSITAEIEADIGIDEDPENNITPSANRADRDGGDDGIVVPLNLPHCGWAAIDYDVTVIDPNVELWVNVWLDFNRDGDWDDVVDCPKGLASEWAVQNQYLYNLPAGLNKIKTPGFLSSHLEDGPENIWMRITLSGQPWKYGSNPGAEGNAGSGPMAKYLIGETEDYFFTPDTTVDVDCPLCKDLNEDGVIDMDDLVVLLVEWLATCP